MSDYSLKKIVLDNGLFQKYKDLKRAEYLYYVNDCNYSALSLQQQSDLGLRDFFYNNGLLDEFKECKRLYDSNRARVCRLKKRISLMLNNDCLFLTLTFTDNTLSTTSCDTRRRYITRFLKSLNCNYVANIDFGSKNGREHYHALVDVSMIDYSKYNLGAINGKKVIVKNESALSKYIAKLTNHSIKSTTKGSRIIYNR